MKVTVESNLDIWGDQTELELEPHVTLKQLLENISTKIRFPIIDPGSGQVDSYLQVRVNRQEHFVLPQQLDTPLYDGDVVDIEVTVVAGG
jgi:sulfur carrier protein ThiS